MSGAGHKRRGRAPLPFLPRQFCPGVGPEPVAVLALTTKVGRGGVNGTKHVAPCQHAVRDACVVRHISDRLCHAGEVNVGLYQGSVQIKQQGAQGQERGRGRCHRAVYPCRVCCLPRCALLLAGRGRVHMAVGFGLFALRVGALHDFGRPLRRQFAVFGVDADSHGGGGRGACVARGSGPSSGLALTPPPPLPQAGRGGRRGACLSPLRGGAGGGL